MINPDNPPPMKAMFIAVAVGVFYGITCQVAFRLHYAQELWAAMSFGFVFILPFIMGFLTLWYGTPQQQRSWIFRICAPWVTIGISLIVSLLVGWEGAICMIAAGVVFLPLASVGGVISGLILVALQNRRSQSGPLASSILASALCLPLISAYIESYYPLPLHRDRVMSSTIIDAPASEVWNNIIRVRPITEPLSGFFYKMGFPRPIEATLSHEGVGGVRQASFERGLLFVETVDVWEPLRRLSFSIVTDPSSIPTTTLDEHVVVGGRYFDVMRGTYEIVPLSDDRVQLNLESEIRVSTRFNFYAGLWARFLMGDIQKTILEVIKRRAEAGEPVK